MLPFSLLGGLHDWLGLFGPNLGGHPGWKVKFSGTAMHSQRCQRLLQAERGLSFLSVPASCGHTRGGGAGRVVVLVVVVS